MAFVLNVQLLLLVLFELGNRAALMQLELKTNVTHL
jgi:hypothetical protein